MSNEQKLREALQKIAEGNVMKDEFSHLETVIAYQRIARQTLALPTAAPVDEQGLPPLHPGCLPTMNQDPYPSLGDWWVQLWDGSGDDAKVVARVYGSSPEQARQRAEAMCAAIAKRGA